MDLQGGWSSGLLLSSWVGPGVLGFQDPLSALPGSFRGTVSSTPSILLMEPGGGGEKWRAVGVPGRGLSQLPWEGLRPSLSHPTWKNKKRTASGSLRGQTGKGTWRSRDRGITATSSTGHATRKLKPNMGKALPPLSGDLLARDALPGPLGSGSRKKPKHPSSEPLTSSLATCPYPAAAQPQGSGRTTAAGQRGCAAARGRTAARGRPADLSRTPVGDAEGARWESPGFENKPLRVSRGNRVGSRAGPASRRLQAASGRGHEASQASGSMGVSALPDICRPAPHHKSHLELVRKEGATCFVSPQPVPLAQEAQNHTQEDCFFSTSWAPCERRTMIPFSVETERPSFFLVLLVMGSASH